MTKSDQEVAGRLRKGSRSSCSSCFRKGRDERQADPGGLRPCEAALRGSRRRHRWRAEDARDGPDLDSLLAGRRRGRLRVRRAARLAAGWRRRATTRAKRARPTSFAQDATKALSLIPGKHRFNLHASYGDFGGRRGRARRDSSRAFQPVDRLGEGARHRPGFQSDVLRASAAPRASRWRIPTGRRASSGSATGSRAATIGAAIGQERSGTPCVTNLWIPDGMKDTPVDRLGPRERLIESLDTIFKDPIDRAHNLDAVEGKLFGIGFESYTVGSHEFYFGYALTRHVLYTLDTGHYHPTETITDKLSAVLHILAGDPAARQPRRPLGQRPRRRSQRRSRSHRAGARPRRLSRAHAHRPRLLRCQHQPRRGLGHRHAQHAEGAVSRRCSNRRRCSGSRKRPPTIPAALRCRRSSRRCRGARSGTITARGPASRRAARGWPRSSSTRATCCPRAA